jgi:hyperosmotically inducible periplasmic protein
MLPEKGGMMIRKDKSIASALLLGASLLLSAPALRAQDQQPAPDNSKMNQGDANQGATTADQQKMNPADRETTKNIRSAIYKDKSLSTYAHNVKVITQDGKVTLKGPVRSDDEKSNIEAKAIAVAGAGNVTDSLTVAPPKQ